MAREYVDEWPPVVLTQRSRIKGNQVPPTTFSIHSLAERRSQLGEEERTSAAPAPMISNRLPQGRIHNLLARLDILRNRAQKICQFMIGNEGLSLLLLRAVGVSNIQVTMTSQNYVQQFQGFSRPGSGISARCQNVRAQQPRRFAALNFQE
eukprot:618263-Pyramimonas_sp.AAC.1